RRTPPSRPARYTLALHDALPIYGAVIGKRQVGAATSGRTRAQGVAHGAVAAGIIRQPPQYEGAYANDRRSNHTRILELERRSSGDRKSTRLNSSHVKISYAVFCL